MILEADEVAVCGRKFGEEEADEADGFVLAELVDRERGVVQGGFGGGGGGKICFLGVIAEVVEGEIAAAAVEPGAGIFDFAPDLAEAEEGLLHEVFGDGAAADETEGEAEESAFFRFEDRGERGRGRDGGKGR